MKEKKTAIQLKISYYDKKEKTKHLDFSKLKDTKENEKLYDNITKYHII